MRIKEIEINNFRIYKGKNIIDIIPDTNKNIIIVSGKNGYGKTTFLMSLVWCLYGDNMRKVDKLYLDEISEQGGYSKYISNSINRLAKLEGDNRFSISISFTNINIPIDVPCREIKITRTYNTSSKDENIEILINGTPNELTKKYGYEQFIRDFILPIEIAKFFFFDAEKIVSLAEIHSVDQRKQLSKAYSEVLGIKKYEDLKNNVEHLRFELKKTSATPDELEKFHKLEAEEKNLISKINNNNEEIINLKEDKIIKKHDLDQIQAKLLKDSHISDEELNDMKVKRAELEIRYENLQKELKNFYDIIPFAISGEKLLEVLTQIRQEIEYQNVKIKQEDVDEKINKIIDELNFEVTQKDLLINRRIQKIYEDALEILIKKHFFPEAINLPLGFDIIHNFSQNEKAELEDLINHLKLSFKEELKRISHEYNQTNYELESIKRKIREAESTQDNEILETLRKTKNILEQGIETIDSKVIELNREIERFDNEKIAKKKELTKLSEKIKITDENKSKENLCKKLISELNDFITNFQNEKKLSLERNIKFSLKQLMHMNLVEYVEVEIIGEFIDIKLYNTRSEEITKESLSKGQQQIFASALLKGLVEESEIEFPVFIDSPMQKFDETHSENIIKYFYPNVSEQVVIFPLLNKELTLKEYEILKPNISKTFLINNINADESEFNQVSIDELMNL
jgi:DNA sulfur modification protein DndD